MDDRRQAVVDAAPVRLTEVVEARRLMRQGKSMREDAGALNIVPSGRLDLALWNHLGVRDESLLAEHWVKTR